MPTGIIDLSDSRPLSRVSWLYQSLPGRFDFYISNKLAGEFIVKSDRGIADSPIVGLKKEFFERNPAFYSIHTSLAQGGRLAHNFKDVRPRYVLTCFVPDEVVVPLAPVSTLKAQFLPCLRQLRSPGGTSAERGGAGEFS